MPSGSANGSAAAGTITPESSANQPSTGSSQSTPSTGRISGSAAYARGAVFSLLGAWDYVIEPLPNLVFARDTCVWIGDRVAVTSPAGRRREAELVAIATGYHPMFAGTKRLYEPDHEVLAGGDVLLLTPGVVAIGVGAHTSPAGMERLARRVFDTGFAHTVLAALTDTGTGECLDTLCTLIGPDTVLMRPSVAYSLVARTITQRDGGLWLSHAQPFLEAAAQAMGLDRLQVIETGLGPARVGPAPRRFGLVAAHAPAKAIRSRLFTSGALTYNPHLSGDHGYERPEAGVFGRAHRERADRRRRGDLQARYELAPAPAPDRNGVLPFLRRGDDLGDAIFVEVTYRNLRSHRLQASAPIPRAQAKRAGGVSRGHKRRGYPVSAHELRDSQSVIAIERRFDPGRIGRLRPCGAIDEVSLPRARSWVRRHAPDCPFYEHRKSEQAG